MQSHNQNYSHDHSHDHTHGGECCQDHDQNPTSSSLENIPLPDDANAADMALSNLFQSVRFGLKTQARGILENSSSMINMLDSGGHSLAHFAAKRGDVEMLQLLFEFGGKMNIAGTSDAKMSPIHWAASEGKIASVRFLIEKRVDINGQDSYGCSPLIVATQHNQATCVAFLARNGADLTIRDNNGDNSLHWAAYTGQMEVVGLLSHLMPHDINNEDSFGQTPLHLAALKGHVAAVEYLSIDCAADLTKKDRNGLTAMDVAFKKSQLGAEWVLRQQAATNTWNLVRNLSLSRLKSSRILKMLICGSNEREISAWPWRVVCSSNLFASLTSLLFAADPRLTDLYPLHTFNCIVQIMWWFCFSMCLFKCPSFVKDDRSFEGQKRGAPTYDGVLDIIGKSDGEFEAPAVCHSCHVCKPIRSKHCKIIRKCINKFDHYCPFVGNAVGRDNYKYFVGLLVVHVLCAVGWEITVSYLWARATISWFLFLYMFYAAGWLMMILFLLQYHVQLITQNLTTNEHINMAKYAYMRNQHNMPDNPFNLKSAKKNIVDGLFPSSRQFYSRDEFLGTEPTSKISEDLAPLLANGDMANV